MKMNMKNVDMALVRHLVVLAILFILLSPGVVLTLPPNENCNIFYALMDDDSRCATSYMSVIVHSIVFVLAVYGVKYFKLA